MCGFTDVRQRLDGSYWCPLCGKELGKDFDACIAAEHGKPSWLQLKQQCSAHPTSEPK